MLLWKRALVVSAYAHGYVVDCNAFSDVDTLTIGQIKYFESFTIFIFIRTFRMSPQYHDLAKTVNILLLLLHIRNKLYDRRAAG